MRAQWWYRKLGTDQGVTIYRFAGGFAFNVGYENGSGGGDWLRRFGPYEDLSQALRRARRVYRQARRGGA